MTSRLCGRGLGRTALAASGLLVLSGGAPAWAGGIERVSVSSTGQQANGASFEFPSISADGRFVAFDSDASNLAPDDNNLTNDVFVHDRKTGKTSRIRAGSRPKDFDADTVYRFPSISGDGRFVTFLSDASNLVPGDTNDAWDIFVHDRRAGRTMRVSLGPTGAQANADSFSPSLSGDGRYVAFASNASNLVAGDTNESPDVFVRDRLKGTTERVSVGPRGRQANGGSGTAFAPAMSADGRYVAFESGATNLADGDTNGASDVFVRDRASGTTERVSVRSDGTEAHGDSFTAAISADGRYVAFESDATDLVPGDTNGTRDVFVHDRTTGVTERVSVGPGGRQADRDVGSPSISGDGRFVGFDSWATNLVPGDTNGWEDAFVRDRVAGRTFRVSVGPKGRQAELGGDTPVLSADGRHIAFTSASGDLVPGDTGEQDIFVRDR